MNSKENTLITIQSALIFLLAFLTVSIGHDYVHPINLLRDGTIGVEGPGLEREREIAEKFLLYHYSVPFWSLFKVYCSLIASTCLGFIFCLRWKTKSSVEGGE